jgi:chromosomal replication initiator protein
VAREALRDLIAISRPPRTFDRIQDAVAKRFSLDTNLLSERTRTDAIAYPRQVAMFLCRELLGASYVLIGEQFGGRDHSTVMHAYEKIRRLKETDPSTRSHLDEIRRVLDA